MKTRDRVYIVFVHERFKHPGASLEVDSVWSTAEDARLRVESIRERVGKNGNFVVYTDSFYLHP